MYFKQFVTDEMLQETAEQTNMYSVQKEGKSVNTTGKKIYVKKKERKTA